MRLSATNIACRRGGREVFTAVGFALASGEILAVTGRNGAGKSSLLRMVAGLLRLAEGDLALDGGDPELTIGEQAHYLGHQDALKPALSVSENLRFWSRFFGGKDAASVPALEAVGLDALADLPAAYLSAGQRRNGCGILAASGVLQKRRFMTDRAVLAHRDGRDRCACSPMVSSGSPPTAPSARRGEPATIATRSLPARYDVGFAGRKSDVSRSRPPRRGDVVAGHREERLGAVSWPLAPGCKRLLMPVWQNQNDL